MDLFPPSPSANLLPRDGTVRYHGSIFSPAESRAILADLLENILWQHDEVVLFGKRIVTARQVAWFADKGIPYTYSGSTKHSRVWSPSLQSLKATVQQHTGARFNACLLNLYRHGNEGMSWHSDDEPSLQPNAPIASLSFGAERRFRFRHKKTRETVSLVLGHGSLLEMRDETQSHWQHCLPKTTKVTTPRINLTFRRMLTPDEER
ncbi:MAG: alpha-ketoglutarate-dependent dioxygenase AlkB [Verrucomicrobia bacterium]|nr:alpha-ketoglutarate-dependent dioxygenase AlkB [Verrucomicrobiota bacterium]